MRASTILEQGKKGKNLAAGLVDRVIVLSLPTKSTEK
jgi:hypothetical protein